MKDVSSSVPTTGSRAAAVAAPRSAIPSALDQAINHSPRQAAQRQRLAALFGEASGEAIAAGRQQAAIGEPGGPVLQRVIWVNELEVSVDEVAGAVGDELEGLEERDRQPVLEILLAWAGDEKQREAGRDFKDWRAAVRAARRRLPSQTIGFELEDSAMAYSTVATKDARKHRPLISDFDPEEMEMIVGADSHPGGYSDLEIRSQPFDITRQDQIDQFLNGYLDVYESLLSSIDGLKKRDTKRGHAIVPQLTVSIPVARLGELAGAGLFSMQDEQEAVQAFDEIADGVDTMGLGPTVKSLAKFLAFYLAGVWGLVSKALHNGDGNKYFPRPISTDGRAVISDKKFHSLFLKEVERNGVAINGVVDMYTQACDELSNSGVAVDPVVETYLTRTLDRLKKPELATFTQDYVRYLADQAGKVKDLGRAYVPEPFRPSQQITMKAKVGETQLNAYHLLLPELEGLRDSTIEPNPGQEHSVFIEERRLGNDPFRGGTSEHFAKQLDERKKTNAVYSEQTKGGPFARDAIDRLRIMVDFYRNFLDL